MHIYRYKQSQVTNQKVLRKYTLLMFELYFEILILADNCLSYKEIIWIITSQFHLHSQSKVPFLRAELKSSPDLFMKPRLISEPFVLQNFINYDMKNFIIISLELKFEYAQNIPLRRRFKKTNSEASVPRLFFLAHCLFLVELLKFIPREVCEQHSSSVICFHQNCYCSKQ